MTCTGCRWFYKEIIDEVEHVGCSVKMFDEIPTNLFVDDDIPCLQKVNDGI